MRYIFHHAGESITLPDPTTDHAAYERVLADAMTRLGPWQAGVTKVEALPDDVERGESFTYPTPAVVKPLSSFSGALHVDAEAVERIEAQHASLASAGLAPTSAGDFRAHQFYDTGTRMVQSGYDAQRERSREHADKLPVRDAIAALSDMVTAEKRREVTVTARELAKTVAVNGRLTVLDGYTLNGPAIRGMLARLGSPASTYVLGLRERIMSGIGTGNMPGGTVDPVALVNADKRILANVLATELERYGETELTLRVRDGLGDVFACVSPSYVPADAPAVLPSLLEALPYDARATFAYDAGSTAWELRASVFTPTSVDEQAVGEPFEGYASFFSRDNGTASLRGGGGIILIRCLNASTYVVEDGIASRRHMRAIMLDLPAMVAGATRATTALCDAWGVARTAELPRIEGVELEALTGYWRHLLTDRKSELVGVFAGRRETHTQALAMMTTAERRSPVDGPYNRADFAQGWTRYVQTQPTLVRRSAESAIGAWLTHPAPMRVETA